MTNKFNKMIFFMLVVLGFSTSSAQEFKIFKQKDTGSSDGKIYVIGTFHEVNNESESCVPVDVANCRKGYIDIINSKSSDLDIILHEGSPRREDQMRPDRAIYKITAQGREVHSRFNKDLFIFGWEDSVTLLLAKMADMFLQQSYKLGSTVEASLAKIRAQYFYFYVVMYQRNKAAIDALSDIVQRAPKNKNIFMLIGGGHLFDPQFMTAVQSLGRDFVVYQNRNVVTDLNSDFELLKNLLIDHRVDLKEFDATYEQAKKMIIAQRGLTQNDMDLIQKKVFGISKLSCAEQLGAR